MHVAGSLLVPLAAATALRRLELHGLWDLTRNAGQRLAALTQLKGLSLRVAKVEEGALSKLAALTGLQRLSLIDARPEPRSPVTQAQVGALLPWAIVDVHVGLD